MSGCSPSKGNTVVVPVATVVKPATQTSPLDALKNADFQRLSDLAAAWMLPAKGGSVPDIQSSLQDRLAIRETISSDDSQNSRYR